MDITRFNVEEPDVRSHPVVRVLQDSVEDTIKNLSSQKISSQGVEIGRLKARLAIREGELVSLKTKLEEMNGCLEAKKAECIKIDAKYKDIKARHSLLEESNQKLEATTREYHQKIISLEVTNQSLSDENTNIKDLLRQCQDDKIKTESDNITLRDQVTNLGYDSSMKLGERMLWGTAMTLCYLIPSWRNQISPQLPL